VQVVRRHELSTLHHAEERRRKRFRHVARFTAVGWLAKYHAQHMVEPPEDV